MTRFRFRWVVLPIFLLGFALLLLQNRSTQGQASDSWRQLSLSEFVQEMDRLTTAAQEPSAEVWAAIRGQSAERLLQAIQGGTVADYGHLVSLYLWARPVLSPQQVQTAQAALVPTNSQVASWSLEQLRSAHVRMTQAELPLATVQALSVSWLEGRDLRTLENVDDLAWLWEQIHALGRGDDAPRSFTVTWTGSVRAPADGAYTFSICPLDLQYSHMGAQRTASMSIWIGQQRVLDSTAQGWTYRSEPVTLSAAAPESLRVELSVSVTQVNLLAQYPAVALLYWEGPGLARQLVPSAALRTPEGNEPGLRGHYVLQTQDEPLDVTRVDPQLNFIWYHGSQVIASHAQLRQELAARLYEVASSVETLARWESSAAARDATWVGAQEAFLESLSPAQQRNWAERLLAHPALLEDCSRRAICELYEHCRIGAADAALRLWGQWAQGHADAAPQWASDFHRANRLDYAELARQTLWQYRPHFEALEEEYLTLPDGRCALPVAYVLSYAHWMEGTLAAWVTQLEARLEDAQLSGDRRVNWLLSRGQAQELRRSTPHRYRRPIGRFLAGEGYLEEATLVAESEPQRLRAYQELAVRMAAYERIDGALAMLERAGERCTSAASSAALTQWRGEVEALRRAFEERREQRETLARSAYSQRLQARRQRALARGDSQASTRYEQLLQQSGATSP